MLFAWVSDLVGQWKMCLDFDLLKQFANVILKKQNSLALEEILTWIL
jgi:hypothetical protein